MQRVCWTCPATNNTQPAPTRPQSQSCRHCGESYAACHRSACRCHLANRRPRLPRGQMTSVLQQPTWNVSRATGYSREEASLQRTASQPASLCSHMQHARVSCVEAQRARKHGLLRRCVHVVMAYTAGGSARDRGPAWRPAPARCRSRRRRRAHLRCTMAGSDTNQRMKECAHDGERT